MIRIDMNMRRGKQALKEGDIQKVLKRCDYGVLCLCGKDGIPYGVPLNYVFADDCFYFHCAMEGRKLQLLKENPKASFTVTDVHKVIPENFSTDYISVVAFGNVAIVGDEAERLQALKRIASELGAADELSQKKAVEESLNHTVILKLIPQRISGKCSGSVIKSKTEYNL